MKSSKLLLGLLMAIGLVASACGSTAETVTDAASDAADAAGDAAGDVADAAGDAADAAGDAAGDVADEVTGNDQPGAGVDVTMARANWSTGYVQASIYKQLLGELGYNVSEPADLELEPSLAYLSMAQGEFDFWVNSWYPGHKSWLEAEMPDGSKVGDKLSIVGEEILAGGLQGFLVTKSVAEENGITTIDQISSDPELSALFDADGNGTADLYGCPESWTCDNIITEQICQFDWNVEQVIAGYDTMIAEATDKANNGEPMIIYTWTPSAYITQLIPGDNVMWISVEGEVSDANCAGQEGGENYAQPNATAAIGTDQCLPSSSGVCNLGWTAADILVTANNEFLTANPAAAELLAQVTLPLVDIALANVAQDQTEATVEDVDAIAAQWIADNRDLVDGWLGAARGAA